jgi:hypothetical protein
MHSAAAAPAAACSAVPPKPLQPARAPAARSAFSTGSDPAAAATDSSGIGTMPSKLTPLGLPPDASAASPALTAADSVCAGMVPVAAAL